MPRIVMSLGRVTPSGVNLLGTCFLLNRKGWFATASHATMGDDHNLVVVLQEEAAISDYQDTTNKNVKLLPAKIEKYDPVHDTAVISIPADAQSTIQIDNLDSTVVGSEVDLFGFPHAEHGRRVLTLQSANIGAKVLLESGDLKVKHAVVNIQSRPGQSGSPVFLRNTNRVVGILIGSYAPGASGISLGGIDPQTLHMTSHAVSAEYLLRMLQ